MRQLTVFFAFTALFVLSCGEGTLNINSLTELLEAIDSSSSYNKSSSSGNQSSGNQGGNQPSGTTGSVTHCGKTYKTIVIGNQTWMAENMNCEASGGGRGSKCYNNQESNCNKYGRLYNWEAAMNMDSNCNDGSCANQINISKHQGICPTGWHVPRDLEWKTLIEYVGGFDVAGRHLKSRNGWDGEDTFGFAALPAGYWGEEYSEFTAAGEACYWWSANDKSSNGNTYWLDLVTGADGAGWIPYPGSMPYWDSVRCIKDSN